MKTSLSEPLLRAKRVSQAGALALGSLSAAALLCSLAATVFSQKLPEHGPHPYLPEALLSIAVFAAFSMSFVLGVRPARLAEKSTAVYLGLLALVACVFWLPVVLTGHFVADDWPNLAAASIRTSVALHPRLAFYTLDAMDGNFRPLGTVLYPMLMLRLAGLHAPVYLLGNFLATFGSALTAFFILRSLRYSRFISASAAVVFLSRSLLYTQVAWLSALGDGLAIFFGALAFLATLRALQQHSAWKASLLHVLAAFAFCAGLLAKQSIMGLAIVLPLLILLYPKANTSEARRAHLLRAAAALLVYAGMSAFVFVHARHLLDGRTPYKLHVGWRAVQASLAYVFWQVSTLDLHRGMHLVPAVMGLAIIALALWLYRCRLSMNTAHRRDFALFLLAGAVSLAVVAPLAPRMEPYYGGMAAFWSSLALAVALSATGAPTERVPVSFGCLSLLAVLVTAGFAEVRLIQAQVLPAGGYVPSFITTGEENWALYSHLSAEIEAQPVRTVVLTGCRGTCPYAFRFPAAMALLAAKHVDRIVAVDNAGCLYGNDHAGQRPADTFAALRDVQAYGWSVRMGGDVLSSPEPATLWLSETDGRRTGPVPPSLSARCSR